MNMIKRKSIISSHFIKLRYRQVGFKIPVSCSIKTFVHTAITTYQVVIGVIGVYPDNMVIYVLAFFAKICKSFAAIFTYTHVGIDNKNFVHIFWIAKYFLIIITTACIAALFFPAGTTVGAFKNTALTFSCFYNSIQNIGVNGRIIQTDSA